MFSSKIYTTNYTLLIELKKAKGVCAQLHLNFYRLAKNVVCAISALVVYAILDELKSETANHSARFHQNFIPLNKYFFIKFKKNKRRTCTIAHEFLQVRQERRMFNIDSPI